MSKSRATKRPAAAFGEGGDGDGGDGDGEGLRR
jgi:hypothetical protein